MKKICRHCQRFVVSRPRGLCWTCFRDTAIRERYPAKVIAGVGADNLARPCPATATDAPPGTDDKIAVLAERARRRESLFHADDVRIPSADAALWELDATPYERKRCRDHSRH